MDTAGTGILQDIRRRRFRRIVVFILFTEAASRLDYKAALWLCIGVDMLRGAVVCWLDSKSVCTRVYI
jgi:hypothetical protein